MDRKIIIDKLLAGGIDSVVYYVEKTLLHNAFEKGKTDGLESKEEYEKGFKAGYEEGYK